MNFENVESLRREEQLKFDNTKSMEERNKFGQYATSPKLATEIINFTLKLRRKLGLGEEKIRFLEPAIGTGAFLSSLLHNVEETSLDYTLGVEKDTEIAKYSKELWGNLNHFSIENEDFIKAPPSKLINLLVTNPPYIRHHHLDKEYKEFIKSQIKQELGYEVSGLSGLYTYFILSSHKWLEKNGLATWLIPSEFMNVNYGDVLKHYLSNKVTLKHVHKYDPREAQFDDALVTSSVVIYQNREPLDSELVTFSYGGSLQSPSTIREVTVKELKNTVKWSVLFNPYGNTSSDSDVKSISRLSDFFDIKRGIATGNNKFFIFTKKEVIEMGLPFECFRPVLPSSRILKESIIEANEEGNPKVTDGLFLLDTDLDEKSIQNKYPKLWDYLKKGEENGVKNGYLIKKRKIWYSQEKRKPSPFLCTYMGRGKDLTNPFRFLYNKSNAIATNGYLLLYPKGKFKTLLNENPNLYYKVLDGLQEIGYEDFNNNGREYGGGLKKVEPKELGNISAEKLVEKIGFRNNDRTKQLTLM